MTPEAREELLDRLLVERFGPSAALVRELGGVADRTRGTSAVTCPQKTNGPATPAKDAGPLDTTTRER